MATSFQLSPLFLIGLAGLMQGTFIVPMKLTREWEWENTWLVFCFLGFIILPAALVLLTVPQPGQVLATAPTRSVALAAVFGLGWGCGAVCFGLGVEKLGISLGVSIILGITSALGSLTPWLTSPAKPLAYSILLWTGVLVMLGGVIVSSLAGKEREKSHASEVGLEKNPRRFLTGLIIAIASGVLSCFSNFGFTYGVGLSRRAEALGASVASAPNILWLVIMSFGFVANASYCGYRLLSRKTWKKYHVETTRYFGWALVMAALWAGSLVAYGRGANAIGTLGTSVGWAILQSMNIITANIWGVATGEWQGAGRRAVSIMGTGVGMLLVAVIIFGWAATKA